MNETQWPGWSITDNPYGVEFDSDARRRMIEVSSLLGGILDRYLPAKKVCEMGPLFNPHATKEKKIKSIVYIEKDPHACTWLQKEGRCIQFDLRKLPDTSASLRSIPLGSYDIVIISHVLNYVDFKSTIAFAATLLRKGGHILISNITNHGCEKEFSEKRPRNQHELVRYVKNYFDIVERHSYKSLHPLVQKTNTHIIVGKKN